MRPWQVLSHQIRMDLGVMAIKRYSTFLKAPELESHDHIQDTHWVS